MRPGRLLPLVLVAAFSAAVACDLGSGPPEPRALVVTVADGAESEIGALLLRVSAPVESGAVGTGSVLLHEDETGTLVAVVLATARRSVQVELRVVADGTPSITVLQAADGANDVYPNPGAFAPVVSDGGAR